MAAAPVSPSGGTRGSSAQSRKAKLKLMGLPAIAVDRTLESFAELVLPIAVQLSEFDDFQELVLRPVLAQREAALKEQPADGLARFESKLFPYDVKLDKPMLKLCAEAFAQISPNSLICICPQPICALRILRSLWDTSFSAHCFDTYLSATDPEIKMTAVWLVWRLFHLVHVLPVCAHYNSQNRSVKKPDVQFLMRYFRLAWSSAEASALEADDDDEDEDEDEDGEESKSSRVYTFDQSNKKTPVGGSRRDQQLYGVDMVLELLWDLFLHNDLPLSHVHRVIRRVQRTIPVARTPDTLGQPGSNRSARTPGLSHSASDPSADQAALASESPGSTVRRSVTSQHSLELQARPPRDAPALPQLEELAEDGEEAATSAAAAVAAGSDEAEASSDSAPGAAAALSPAADSAEALDDAAWESLERAARDQIPANLILLPAVLEGLKRCQSEERATQKLGQLRQLFALHPSLCELVVHSPGWHLGLFELMSDLPLRNEYAPAPGGGAAAETMEDAVLDILVQVTMYAAQNSTSSGLLPTVGRATASAEDTADAELASLQCPGVLALVSNMFSDLRSFGGGWNPASLEVARRLLRRVLEGLLGPGMRDKLTLMLSNPALSVASQRWRAVFELVAAVMEFTLFTGTDVVVPGDIRLKDGADTDDDCPFDEDQLGLVLGSEQLVLRRTSAPEAILDDHRYFDVSLQGSVRLHRHPVAKIFEDLPIVELCSDLLEFLAAELQPPAKKKQLSAAQLDYQNCLETAAVARDFFRLLTPLLQPRVPGDGFPGAGGYSAGGSGLGGSMSSSPSGNAGRRQKLLEQLVANPLMGKLSACLRQHIVLTSRFEEFQQQLMQSHSAGGPAGPASPSKAHSPRADPQSQSTVAPVVYVGPDGQTALKSGPVVTLLSSDCEMLLTKLYLVVGKSVGKLSQPRAPGAAPVLDPEASFSMVRTAAHSVDRHALVLDVRQLWVFDVIPEAETEAELVASPAWAAHEEDCATRYLPAALVGGNWTGLLEVYPHAFLLATPQGSTLVAVSTRSRKQEWVRVLQILSSKQRLNSGIVGGGTFGLGIPGSEGGMHPWKSSFRVNLSELAYNGLVCPVAPDSKQVPIYCERINCASAASAPEAEAGAAAASPVDAVGHSSAHGNRQLLAAGRSKRARCFNCFQIYCRKCCPVKVTVKRPANLLALVSGNPLSGGGTLGGGGGGGGSPGGGGGSPGGAGAGLSGGSPERVRHARLTGGPSHRRTASHVTLGLQTSGAVKRLLCRQCLELGGVRKAALNAAEAELQLKMPADARDMIQLAWGPPVLTSVGVAGATSTIPVSSSALEVAEGAGSLYLPVSVCRSAVISSIPARHGALGGGHHRQATLSTLDFGGLHARHASISLSFHARSPSASVLDLNRTPVPAAVVPQPPPTPAPAFAYPGGVPPPRSPPPIAVPLTPSQLGRAGHSRNPSQVALPTPVTPRTPRTPQTPLSPLTPRGAALGSPAAPIPMATIPLDNDSVCSTLSSPGHDRPSHVGAPPPEGAILGIAEEDGSELLWDEEGRPIDDPDYLPPSASVAAHLVEIRRQQQSADARVGADADVDADAGLVVAIPQPPADEASAQPPPPADDDFPAPPADDDFVPEPPAPAEPDAAADGVSDSDDDSSSSSSDDDSDDDSAANGAPADAVEAAPQPEKADVAAEEPEQPALPERPEEQPQESLSDEQLSQEEPSREEPSQEQDEPQPEPQPEQPQQQPEPQPEPEPQPSSPPMSPRAAAWVSEPGWSCVGCSEMSWGNFCMNCGSRKLA